MEQTIRFSSVREEMKRAAGVTCKAADGAKERRRRRRRDALDATCRFYHMLHPNDNLDDLIQQDADTLAQQSANAVFLAKRIRHLAAMAMCTKRLPIVSDLVDRAYHTFVDTSYGRYRVMLLMMKAPKCPCPFGCSARNDFHMLIINWSTYDWMTVPSVILHTMEKHTFFGGNCKFRVDPLVALRVMALDNKA